MAAPSRLAWAGMHPSERADTRKRSDETESIGRGPQRVRSAGIDESFKYRLKVVVTPSEDLGRTTARRGPRVIGQPGEETARGIASRDVGVRSRPRIRHQRSINMT